MRSLNHASELSRPPAPLAPVVIWSPAALYVEPSDDDTTIQPSSTSASFSANMASAFVAGVVFVHVRLIRARSLSRHALKRAEPPAVLPIVEPTMGVRT